MNAEREAQRILGAAERVADFVHARAPAELAELRADIGAREAKRKTPANVRAVALARRAVHDASGAHRWGWKLITISPAWNPSDARSYGVQGLRARLEDVRARWARVWESGASVSGLAGAYLRVELSDRGHVHAHVLFYGPWVSQKWLARVAGCIVDVRAVGAGRNQLRGGVREAIKYAVKGPSPLRSWWVGGERNRTTHPELAASWTIATRGRRLAEPYGVFRDAIRAHDACDGEPSDRSTATVVACASCGSESLSAAREIPTALLAMELRSRGAHLWSWRTTRPATAFSAPLLARINVVSVWANTP